MRLASSFVFFLGLGLLSLARACDDKSPPGGYTCQQQKSFGACGSSWMQGYCDLTCGRCSNSPPPSSSCSDNPPPGSSLSCGQQAAFGQCSQGWMQGYCNQSCNRCSSNNTSGSCPDTPPPGSSWSCTQQAAFGQCGQQWMQGYCLKSCGHCPGAPINATAVAPAGCTTLSDLLASQSDLSLTRRALDSVGLLDKMKDPNVKVTFLAPTDSAWGKLESAAGLSDDQLASPGAKQLLELLLSFHVSPTVSQLSGFWDGEQVDTLLSTNNGQKVQFTVKKQGSQVSFQAKNTANVVEGDKAACLSYVHKIDDVLLPKLS